MAAPNPPPRIGPIGPLRRPGRYNLQTIHEDHDVVGQIMTDSRNRWLTGHELNLILQNANSLTVSTPSARNGSIGLFLYNVRAYRDDMLWLHFDGGVPQTWTMDGVRCTQSTNFQNEAYRRRVHRRFQRHGILAVVHYRIV